MTAFVVLYLQYYKCIFESCVKRESNPQFNLGRVACYHYTINAVGMYRAVSHSLCRILSYSFPGYLDRTGDILISANYYSQKLYH